MIIALGWIAAARAAAQVRPGIEVLVRDSLALVAGRRVSLLSNQTGVDRAGRRDVDVLRAAGVRVVALFSPEHGFQGREDRPGIPDAVDSATGLPIYSLYGGAAGAARALDSTDVVLVDLQDIGARYYTYVSTATELMQAAAARGLPVVVLDRPDPLGGRLVQGDVRDSTGDPRRDFVGFLPVPMRHGMTLGELLRMADDLLAVHARLTVVPAAGWRRGWYFDRTGLPWVRPSPNMPDFASALLYPGLCLFEGTNLSVGRGTPFAFQVIGAPWLDAVALARAVRASGLAAGIAIDTVTFTPDAPTDGKYAGVPLRGLRFRVTDRSRADPPALAVALLAALERSAPGRFAFRAEQFDRLAGGGALRAGLVAGRDPRAIVRSWAPALARFRKVRAKYLLY